MKFFMSSLTFNILSRKCSDERKFSTETLQYQDSKSSENGGNRGLVVEEIDVMA